MNQPPARRGCKEDAMSENDAETMANLLAKVPKESRWIVCLVASAFIDGMTVQEKLNHPASIETVEIARRLGMSTRRVQQIIQEAAQRRKK